MLGLNTYYSRSDLQSSLTNFFRIYIPCFHVLKLLLHEVFIINWLFLQSKQPFVMKNHHILQIWECILQLYRLLHTLLLLDSLLVLLLIEHDLQISEHLSPNIPRIELFLLQIQVHCFFSSAAHLSFESNLLYLK